VKRPRAGIPLRAIIQVTRAEWGLRYRLAEQPSRVTVHGVRLDLDGGWASPRIRETIYRGYYESSVRVVLTSSLAPDDSVLDLGAGVGFVTTLACRVVGDSRVVAYEANPQLAERARATARLNGFEPTIVNAAIAVAAGETELYVRDDFWTSTIASSAEGRPIRVPAASLREALDRATPSYVIFDIEGAEVAALEETQLPDYVRGVCLELHPEIVGVEATQRMLTGLMNDGFMLDLGRSAPGVAFFSRYGD
jgi:FkbM family methyltransferase